MGEWDEVLRNPRINRKLLLFFAFSTLPSFSLCVGLRRLVD